MLLRRTRVLFFFVRSSARVKFITARYLRIVVVIIVDGIVWFESTAEKTDPADLAAKGPRRVQRSD